MPEQPPHNAETTEPPGPDRVTGDPRTAAASPIQEHLTATGTAPAFPPPLPTEPLQQSPPDPAGLPAPGHRLG